MDYKQKYEQLAKFIKDLYPHMSDYCKEKIEGMFPELKESEDEKIRKALIQHIKYKVSVISGWRKEELIAWLEKQGEKANPYSGTSFEYNGNTWGMCARDNGVEILIDSKIKAFISLEKSFIYPQPILTSKSALETTNVDNQNYAKPTGKGEPKIKVGDWVVYERGDNVYQIHSIDDSDSNYIRYICKPEPYNNDDAPCFYEKMIHLWTIQDAKDGDVLAFDNGTIVIFKDLYNATTFHSYCHIENDIFNISKDDMPDWWEGKRSHPATKEQRDILFQKMKEAGYGWDAEKKELKKIQEKPADKKYTFNAIPRLLSMIQPTDGAKAYCKKLIDILIQEGYNVDAKIVGNCLKEMNKQKVAMSTMDEQKLADKVEPKFKVGDIISDGFS